MLSSVESMRPRRLRRVAAAAVASACALGVSGGLAPAASAVPGAPAAAAAGTACLSQALTGQCTLPVNPAGAGTPYTLTVPAGMTSVTVLLAGGRGANGDDGATGGRGGLTVAQVPLSPGQTVQVYVATGASSTHPGQGWRNGGAGVSASGAVESDSGGGGGASAVVAGAAPLAVAGGGGGAGGSFNTAGLGGNGGSAGLPATAGRAGTGPNSTSENTNTTYPGGGGCANHDQCSTNEILNGGGHRDRDGNGGAGASVFSQEPGGGGGAGWPFGGYGAGSAIPNPLNPFEFAGGGGGGGGQDYVTPSGGTTLATGSTNSQDGSVSFLPSGAVQRFPCTGPSSQASYQVPAGAFGVLAVAVGGRGGDTNDSDKTGAPGRGALTVGLLPVDPGQTLTVTPGCVGYGRNPSPGQGVSGGGGHAPAFNADDGGGGGGGSAVTTSSGTILLNAGGGGGSGGYAATALNDFKVSRGGGGGDAGLGWGRSGAGSGHSGDGTGGGAGGASTQPNGHGDYGSDGNDTPASGGGGGGGGGGVGGRGGDASDGSGGSGGGAGSSSYDASVTNPQIGTATGFTDGTVILIPTPGATGYDNNGIGATNSGPGFDGSGNFYDPTGLAAAGLAPGAVATIGAVRVPWPNVPVGSPDNYLAHGQTLPLTGVGSTLVVLGAADYGSAGGPASVHFSDGTSQDFTLSFADWATGSPAPGTSLVTTIPGQQENNTASIYAQTVTLPADKTATSLTLPNISSRVGQNVTALHVFSYALGGNNNNGITAAQGSASTDGLFDGNGDAYDPSSLAGAGLSPGASVQIGPVSLTWPQGVNGPANNYTAQGQVVPLTGTGGTLALLGASSYGANTGIATITYTDGSTQTFPLGFGDWYGGPIPGTTSIATAENNFHSYGAQVYSTTVALAPGKTAATLSLPNGSPAVAGTKSLHIFALGVGGPGGAAPGADLAVSLFTGTPPAGGSTPTTTAANAAAASVPAGSRVPVTVRVDHRGTMHSGRYLSAVLLPPGTEPTDLAGGFRLGQLVVSLGDDLAPGGSVSHTLTVTAPPPGISLLTAITLGSAPDPNLANNLGFHLLITR